MQEIIAEKRPSPAVVGRVGKFPLKLLSELMVNRPRRPSTAVFVP